MDKRLLYEKPVSERWFFDLETPVLGTSVPSGSRNGYGYEDGAYNRIRMEWNDERHVLRIGGSLRRFPGSLNGRNCVVHCADKTASFIYTGEEIMIQM